MCAPPTTRGRGRPALYPWETWTDGRVHAVHASMYQVALTSLRACLIRHASQRGLRLRTQLDGDVLRFQFLPKGSRQDFALEDRRGQGNRASRLGERRSTIEAFAAGRLTPEEACAQLGGVSRQRLYQVVRRLGLSEQLERNRYSLWRQLSEEDKRAWRTGAIDAAALAAKLGIQVGYLRTVLRQAGVKREVVPWRCNAGAARSFDLSAEEIADYLNDRETVESLAARKGCSAPTVNNMLTRQGVRKNSPRRDRFRLSRRECKALRLRQVSQMELARRRGVTNQTVRKAMLRQGVIPTPPWEELS